MSLLISGARKVAIFFNLRSILQEPADHKLSNNRPSADSEQQEIKTRLNVDRLTLPLHRTQLVLGLVQNGPGKFSFGPDVFQHLFDGSALLQKENFNITSGFTLISDREEGGLV